VRARACRWAVFVIAGASLVLGCSDGDDDGSRPDLTNDEAALTAALSELGLTAEPFEHAGPRGATVAAPLSDGSTLQVAATLNEVPAGEADIVERRTMGETVVETFHPVGGASGIYDRFTCGDLTYAVSVEPGPRQASPPGFADNEAFLAQLIEALDC
jgi:hypothetical protein